MGFYDNMHTQQLEKLRAQERLALSEAQRDAAAAQRASADEPVKLAEIAAALDRARFSYDDAEAVRTYRLKLAMIVGGAAGYFWGQTTSRNRTPGP
jgi:hypothetical protein